MSAPIIVGDPVYYSTLPTEVGIPAQRSCIRLIDIAFDQPVTVDSSGVVINCLSSPYGSLGPVSFTTTVNGNVLTLKITTAAHTPDTEYGSLDDGRYELTITAGSVVNNNNNENMAVDFLADFFRFFGDINGDGSVNDLDLPTMQQAVGAPKQSPHYRSYLDFSLRGVITSADYQQFMRRYPRTLP